MYLLRGDVPRPVRTVRGDKEWEANCCLYVGFPLRIPPDLVTRSTSPRRGLPDHVCFAERAVFGDSREQEFGQIEADEAAVQHEFGDGSADDGRLLHSVS